jgi:hypothetical protein
MIKERSLIGRLEAEKPGIRSIVRPRHVHDSAAPRLLRGQPDDVTEFCPAIREEAGQRQHGGARG